MYKAILFGLLSLTLVVPAFAQTPPPPQPSRQQNDENEHEGGGDMEHLRQMRGMLPFVFPMLRRLADGMVIAAKSGEDAIILYCPAPSSAGTCVDAASALIKAVKRDKSSEH